MTTHIQNLELLGYPRTPHLEGSRLQSGDEGAKRTSYSRLVGRYIVVEEKLDGGNSGISFTAGGEMLLQSRGHYLVGGGRERQFGLFKKWAACHEGALLDRLEDRYVVYGEVLHKKHAIAYDRLPHIWCEFDVWDRHEEVFLSTARRRDLLRDAPVVQVPVLYAGPAPKRLEDLTALVRRSYAKSEEWRASFERVVRREGFDLERAWQMADKSDLMEGLYIKCEEDGQVIERMKWVRPDFIQAILDSGKHHSEQPFIPNELAPGADIFSPHLTLDWVDLGLEKVATT